MKKELIIKKLDEFEMSARMSEEREAGSRTAYRRVKELFDESKYCSECGQYFWSGDARKAHKCESE